MKLYAVTMTASYDLLVLAEDARAACRIAESEASDGGYDGVPDWTSEAEEIEPQKARLPEGWSMKSLVYGPDDDVTVEEALELVRESLPRPDHPGQRRLFQDRKEKAR